MHKHSIPIQFTHYKINPPITQETLDADDTPLISQSGVKMSRDIVQFVPLRQFQNQSGANFSLVSVLCYQE